MERARYGAAAGLGSARAAAIQLDGVTLLRLITNEEDSMIDVSANSRRRRLQGTMLPFAAMAIQAGCEQIGSVPPQVCAGTASCRAAPR